MKQVNLKGQHLGWFLTFLAGLTILAHAVVPHHHHFEITHSPGQESTCETHAPEKIPEDPDSHCHAFNILISERVTNSSFNKSLSEYFSFYITGINANIEIPPVKNFTVIIFGHRPFFLKQFHSTAQPLRAPPSV